MELQALDIAFEMQEFQNTINEEIEWVSGNSKYKAEELHVMTIGDFDQKMIYISNKLRKQQEAIENKTNN